MFEVGVVVQFRATHRLDGDFGPARRRHGHNYRVIVTGKGPKLREDGTLCDIAMLDRIVQDAVDAMRFQDLNGMSAFHGRNSTAEVVAEYLYEQIASKLEHNGLASLVIRVWESTKAYGSYEGLLS